LFVIICFVAVYWLICADVNEYNLMTKKIDENNGKSGIENNDFFRFVKTYF